MAIFVDSILLLIMSGPFAEIRHGAGYWRIGWSGRHLFWPGLITIVYFVLLEGIAGATIGKFATGIRVVNQDGTKLDWPAAIVRNVARIVDAFPYVFPYLVGAISVWASPNQQRLGDRWANTVVVTKESIAVPSGGVPGPGRGRRLAACARPASGGRLRERRGRLRSRLLRRCRRGRRPRTRERRLPLGLVGAERLRARAVAVRDQVERVLPGDLLHVEARALRGGRGRRPRLSRGVDADRSR